MFRLTPAREEWLNTTHQELNWLGRYRMVEQDVKRKVITTEELQSLPWHFNFTPSAGGRGRHSLKQVRFSPNKIYVPGYPPMDYFLVDPIGNLPPDLSEGLESATHGDPGSPQRLGRMRQLLSSLMSLPGSPLYSMNDGMQHAARDQCLQIANFPPHYVQRIESTKDWLINNNNVQIVSCGPDGVLGDYDEFGFLTDRSARPDEAE